MIYFLFLFFYRFCEGLKTLGVLNKIQRHPDSFRPLFCYRPCTMTTDQVDDLRISFIGQVCEHTRNLTPFFFLAPHVHKRKHNITNIQLERTRTTKNKKLKVKERYKNKWVKCSEVRPIYSSIYMLYYLQWGLCCLFMYRQYIEQTEHDMILWDI